MATYIDALMIWLAFLFITVFTIILIAVSWSTILMIVGSFVLAFLPPMFIKEILRRTQWLTRL